MPSSDLNELSSVIGELRNFAAQQVVTNTHMLEELKKIGDRMSSFGEIGATFSEYRKTLQERIGKINEQDTSIDEDIEKLQTRMNELERVASGWQANWKLLVAGLTTIATIMSSILSNYGSTVLRSLVH